MALRTDSYCGTVYVDTEAESFGGQYPVGPHPYETCLVEQYRRLNAGYFVGMLFSCAKHEVQGNIVVVEKD